MMTKKEQLQQGMLLVDEPTMRRWLSMADCIPAVEAAYAQFSRGETILPPIVSMALEDRNAELDVKTGFIPGCNRIAVKMAAGFYENEKRYGLPSWPALVMVADGDSGFPLAVMDGGYLTTVRTGAAGAVGAKYLARKDAHTVFIMGAGNQARIQLAGLVQVLPNLKAGFWLYLICGLANGLANFFVVYLSLRVAASVMFPVISAGGIVLTFFISLFFYKEKLSKWQILGSALGLVSVIFLNL